MLGQEISDPHHVETGGSSKGLGLLDMETNMVAHKHTVQVRARTIRKSWKHESVVQGYEIHMGVTRRADAVSPCFQILSDDGQSSSEPCDQRDDGGMRADGLVWGTYIHGVFDQPTFRRQWLNRLRMRKKLAPLDVGISESVSDRLAHALDRWADHVEKHINMSPIFSALNVKRV